MAPPVKRTRAVTIDLDRLDRITAQTAGAVELYALREALLELLDLLAGDD